MKKISILILLLLGLIVSYKNMSLSIILAVFSIILAVFIIFEKKDTAIDKIVIISILSAVASAGRVLFSSIPSVQPASFIIMITGIVFGGEAGFITGAITALSSNLLLGQGPWTVWQMLCWGLMGYMSAVFYKILIKNKFIFSIYGLIWGFIFGIIMNSWILFSGSEGIISLERAILLNIASFPMDLAHGVFNLLLILLFAGKFIKIFKRIAVKYDI